MNKFFNQRPALAFCISALVASGIFSFGCSTSSNPGAQENGDDNHSDSSEPESSRFNEQFLDACKDYRSMGRVDDETRWDPMMSQIPKPSIGRISDTKKEGGHDGKLYFLFAKKRSNYLNSSKFDQPEGQIIVMESWTHKAKEKNTRPSDDLERITEKLELTEEQKLDFTAAKSQSYLPFSEKDGTWLEVDAKTELYVMLKTAQATDDNDEGWVYAIVSEDSSKVIESGKIESCMSCHQTAPRDRIFGLTRSRDSFK